MFTKLTIKEVEAMVGRKADDVQMVNSWIVLTFANGTGAPVKVRFKKW